MAKLTPEQARVFLGPNYGELATLRRDGSPQLTTIWVDYDESTGDVLFNITETRRKRAYLERDPRATVLVHDDKDPYRWVAVSGTVTLERGGATEHIHKLSRKYRGRDYVLPEGEQRVIARMKPDRVTAHNV